MPKDCHPPQVQVGNSSAGGNRARDSDTGRWPLMRFQISITSFLDGSGIGCVRLCPRRRCPDWRAFKVLCTCARDCTKTQGQSSPVSFKRFGPCKKHISVVECSQNLYWKNLKIRRNETWSTSQSDFFNFTSVRAFLPIAQSVCQLSLQTTEG